MKKRTTIRDIAEKAGCHFSTVSLALRNNPKISKENRERIHKIAESMGYRPDPYLSGLTAYRSQKTYTNNITCLAWLITSEDRNWGENSTNFPFYFKGALSRAEERGYRIEKFWLNEKGMNPQRMSNILYNRGIVGLLLPHSERPKPVDFNWKHFAPLCLGNSTTRPKLHRVAPNEYQNVSLIMQETFLRGYRRPALVESTNGVVRFENHWLGAFLTEQACNPHIDKITPYIYSKWSLDDFARWIEKSKPDVIISRSTKVKEALEELGYSIPEDIGLAYHCIVPGEYDVTGTTKNAFEMGKMAVDFVIDMLHRHERGVPKIAQRHLVDGCWVEGGTLRKRPRGNGASLGNESREL